MDKISQAPEMEVVDLGDAKEVTMGVLAPIDEEEHPDYNARN